MIEVNMDKKEVIRQELSQRGLPTDLVDLMNIGENDKVEDIVAKIKVMQVKPQLKSFDEFIESNKDFQAEFDRRITKALLTQKEKMDSQKKDESKKSETANNPEIQALQEQIRILTDLIKTVSDQTTRQTKLAEVKEKVKAANLPESWINRIDLTNEKSVEDQIKVLKTDFDEIKQSVINEAVKSGDVATAGQKKAGDVDVKDIETYISKKEEAKPKLENSSLIRFN